jgi:anti-sigma factor RsiW
MDRCRDFRRLLSRDLDGELDETGRARLEAHLGACETCAAERRLWMRIREAVREEADALDGAPSLRILEGARRGETLLPFVRRAAAAAALLVAGSIALLLALGQRADPAPLAPRSADLGRAYILDHAATSLPGLAADEREGSR